MEQIGYGAKCTEIERLAIAYIPNDLNACGEMVSSPQSDRLSSSSSVKLTRKSARQAAYHYMIGRGHRVRSSNAMCWLAAQEVDHN